MAEITMRTLAAKLDCIDEKLNSLIVKRQDQHDITPISKRQAKRERRKQEHEDFIAEIHSWCVFLWGMFCAAVRFWVDTVVTMCFIFACKILLGLILSNLWSRHPESQEILKNISVLLVRALMPNNATEPGL